MEEKTTIICVLSLLVLGGLGLWFSQNELSIACVGAIAGLVTGVKINSSP